MTIKEFIEKWDADMATMDAHELKHGRISDSHETAHLTRAEVQQVDYLVQEYKLNRLAKK